MSATVARVRIDQLDGLRGLAIVLVVLNHLRLDPLYQLAPSWLHPWLGALTGNGKIGVSLLFMLSGFLMAALYPVVTSKFDFWQKRYTRIFPAFVAMSVAMAFIRLFWHQLPTAALPAIVILVVTAGGLGWRLLQESAQRRQWGRWLFWAFLGLQLVTALAYLFVLTRVPPAVFYQVWSDWLRHAVFLVVNATMTLPLGVYVPQLDGVYWSVLTEVLFYLLYPMLVIPVVHLVAKKNSPWLTGLVLLAVFPFLYGMAVVFKAILGLSILQIHLAIYFIAGATIGFGRNSKLIKTVHQALPKLPALVLVVLCLFGVLGLALVRNLIQTSFVVETLYWVVPIASVFVVTLEPRNLWSTGLQLRPLRWLGQVSYALYLTHTIAIEMFTRLTGPRNLEEMVTMAGSAVIVMGILSYVVHHFLEKPYFAHLPKTMVATTKIKPGAVKKSWLPPAGRLAWGVTAVVIFLVWLGYKIPAPLSTLVVNHQQAGLAAATHLTTEPVSLNFHGRYPNLGMLFVYLQPLTDDEVRSQGYSRGADTLAALNIAVTDSQQQTVVSNNYDLYQISESRFHPVGMPVTPQSLGEPYQVQLQLTSPNPSQVVMLRDNGTSFRSVYFFSKRDLVQQPKLLAQVLVNKLIQPFAESEARWVLACVSPMVLTLMALSWSGNPNLLQSLYASTRKR